MNHNYMLLTQLDCMNSVTTSSDLTFNLIYLKLPKYKHQHYLENRRKPNETPELQAQRLESENQQFDEFEEKLKTILQKNINLTSKRLI